MTGAATPLPQGRRAWRFALALVLFVAGGNVWLAWSTTERAEELERWAARNDDALADLQRIVGDLGTIKEQRARLNASLHLLKRIRQSRGAGARPLDMLTETLPADVVLRSLEWQRTEEGDALQLSVTGPDASRLSFLARLEAAGCAGATERVTSAAVPPVVEVRCVKSDGAR